MPQAFQIPLYLLLLFTFSHGSTLHSLPLIKAPQKSNSLLLNAYAAQSGPVYLTQDSAGFYVPVDLSDDSKSSSDDSSSSSDADSANMLIALYTSNTLFAEDCLAFFEYDCTKYSSCSPQNNTQSNLIFPYFNATGYYINNDAYLDYAYWNLQNRATVATSCASNTTTTYGVETAGILGLGATGNASGNYLASPIFSLYIDKSGQTGELLFKSDLSNAESDTPVATITSNSDWHISGVNSIHVASSTITLTNTSLIFDVNANAIGLPLQVYNQVINALSAISSVSCPNSSYNAPTCEYGGEIQNLPNLGLNVQSQTINIPPQAYVKGGEYNSDRSNTGNIVLNLKALDPTLSGASYVTPPYSNYVILDSNVMTYYYTVFSSSKSGTGTITIYVAGTHINHIALFVCIGCGVILLGLLIACVYVKRKQRLEKAAAHMKLQEETESPPEENSLRVNQNAQEQDVGIYSKFPESGLATRRSRGLSGPRMPEVRLNFKGEPYKPPSFHQQTPL